MWSGLCPHSTTGWPFLARVIAKAVPYEPAPITVIDALRFSSGILMWFSTFGFSLLLQIVHEQRVEVDRCQIQLREGTAGNQAGDALTGIREQNVRAVCTQAMRHLVAINTGDAEDTTLLNFAQERSFVAQ